MAASERSLTNALLVSKFGFGLFSCCFGLLLFNTQHPLGTGIVSLGFIVGGFFFLSVARVKAEGNVLKYRRWFSWKEIPYSEIRECGESWVFGYVRIGRYIFPWGSIFFARPNSSDSLFGLDKEVISTIRSRAHI
jgi:hypothetical protein